MNLFDIDKSHCVTTEQKLLWNVMQYLGKETEPTIVAKPKEKTKTYKCKTCGEIYPNAGGMLACAKKHKKESE